MIGKPKAKAPTEQAVRDLLERYACPVPLHVVRTRFLGSIATPVMTGYAGDKTGHRNAGAVLSVAE